MESNKTRIYVISHSPKDIVNIKEDELYKALFVGRNGKDNMGYISDDTGDNISGRNPDYAELTGLYWMWKNSDADIVGLCHYRRYFKNNNHRINKKEISSYLNDYNIIVPKKIELLKGTLEETYKDSYLLEVYSITRNIISEKYPDYLKSYDEVFKESSFSNFNMFIMRKELLDDYCEWLFDILFEVEKRVDLTIIKRVLGLVSEFIFNVWIRKKNLTTKEVDLEYVGTALNFRMILTRNSFLRNLYRKFYFNHAQKNEGNKLESFIQNLFFK